ncbi:uncharacterized [Tachysurus ichikawai]
MLIADGAHYGGGRGKAAIRDFCRGNKSALMNRQQRRGRDQPKTEALKPPQKPGRRSKKRRPGLVLFGQLNRL